MLTNENTPNKAKLNIIEILFIAFCIFPFIIPNPIVVTNVQPYATVLGAILIVFRLLVERNVQSARIISFFAVSFATLGIAVAVMFFEEITISSFRALFNYAAVAIIPMALYLVLSRVRYYPEKLIKVLILVWFFVSTVQFFVSRSFMTSIIGGVRFSESYRGVVGLASEPSFLGIACFYFLHMITKFKEKQGIYFALVLVMGIVYAQSMVGVLFIACFLAVYMLDVINTRRGFYIWLAVIFGVIIFIVLLNTVLVDTRLYKLIMSISEEGVGGMLEEDVSAGNRYESLTGAIRDSFENYLLPLGFTVRIGSGYGGFLCELGFFALPILCLISFMMSRSFKKKICGIIYFVVITILLFNNTQIGNPLLLFVIGTNIYFSICEKRKGEI